MNWAQFSSSVNILDAGLLWDWNENWLFQSCGHCWVFQICWHIESSTLSASSFRIWNSSSGIPSSPLALFISMLLKAYLTSHSRVSGYRWMTKLSWLSAIFRIFYSSSVYSCYLFIWSLPFLSFIMFNLAWNIPFLSPIFLKKSLIFPFLLVSSIYLHHSLKKNFFF